MINLLPPQQEEEILEEEKLKLVLIFGLLLSAWLISFSLVLVLIKTSISTDTEIQKIALNQRENELNTAKARDLEATIRELNRSLAGLNSFYKKQLNLTQVFEKISKTLPNGAYLTNLNFNSIKDEGEGAQIFLSGFSKSREILLSFKSNLEKEIGFSEVYFSPENWVKPTDINFNVNFKLK